MRKPYTPLSRCIALLIVLSAWNFSYAQCDNTGNQFPGSAITVDPGGATSTISTCNFDGEFSEISGIANGADYEFTSSAGGYITVYSGSSAGTLLDHGLSPLTVTAPSASNLYAHWNVDAACGTASSCLTTTVQLQLSCSPPTATMSAVDDCPNTQFNVDVDITSIGSSATVDIEYTVNAGAVNTVSGLGTGIETIGPFAINDVVDVNIIHDTDPLCDLALGTISDNNTCPNVVTCGSGPLNQTYCYGSNDGTQFLYTSSDGSPLTMTFNAGGIESCCDDITIYDGSTTADPVLFTGANSGNLAGIVATSTGGAILLEVDSDGSVDCQQGSTCCATNWDWDVECFLCSPPAATAVASDDCPNNQFNVTVDLTSLGDATTVDITESVNGGTASTIHTAVSTLTTYAMGPYTVGDVVDIVVVHDADATCNVPLSGITDNNTCPTVISCGTPLNNTHCYSDLDATNWKWSSSNGGTITITFNAGGIESCCDDILLYEGTDNTGTLIYQGNNSGDLSGLTFTTTGSELYMEIDSDGSVDCDQGSTCCATTWDWDVACFLCVQPAATAAIDPNCGAGTYTIDVDLTSIGSSTDVDITADVNGGGATSVHSAVSSTGIYVLGPYNVSDVVDVAVVHNDDNSCNIAVGTVGPALCATQSTCALGLSIPDNSCPTTTNFILPATAAGTQLGTDIFLNSVDLIASHSWNSDMEISLTSPNGVTVSLVADRFGSGDNLGDPSDCPNTVFTLQDGGAAMTTSATSNVSGVFAPEAPLTGFDDGSDPNGDWTINVCDDAGGDTGSLEYIQLNFVTCVSPTATGSLNLDCANSQFFIDVDITDLGTATDVDIVSDVNGVESAAVNTLGIVTVGPYASGSTVNISVEHNQDNACDITVGTFDFTCPPVNDTCAGAIMVACNSLTSGSTATGATTVDAPATCVTPLNTAPGVWYSVMGTGGTLKASLCFAPFDSKLGVFEGTCGALVCVDGEDDDFTECGGNDPSVSWSSTSGTTYYIYVTGFSTNTGTFDLQVACEGGSPPCTDNQVSLEFETDASASETSWEILANGLSVPVCEGSGLPNNSTFTVSCCLLDGCYALRVFDSFGDGINPGGYTLFDANGDRIIDNAGDGFDSGSLSAIGSGGIWCVPLGTDKLTFATCDKEDYEFGDFIVAEYNAAVAAEFGVGDQTDDGFQFWIFDPDGSYSRRIFRSHANPSIGAPVGASAANHLSLLQWVTLPIPTDVLLNVRVRGRVNGVYSEFGPACRIKVDPAAAACPTTQLLDDPSNQFFSCGVTRDFGGSDKIWATPVAGANKYQFQFEIAAEGFLRRIASPNYVRALNWFTLPLEAGKTYDTQVRISFDNGANYCPFGPVCSLTIANSTALTGGSSAHAPEFVETDGELTFWPNPNRGDILNLIVNDIDLTVDVAQITILDGFGKVVYTSSLPVIDGHVNGQIDLEADFAAGMYLLNVNAGSQRMTSRIIMQ